MTDEEAQAAAAYLKLQENVRLFILETVTDELIMHPYGPFATHVKDIATRTIRPVIDREIQNYHIVHGGVTAPSR